MNVLFILLQSTNGLSTLSVVAGAIPVVGSIIGGLINNSNTDQINAENQQFQLEQQQQQEAYNTEMWNAENAYNSPSEVMQRYTDAGLNPNLIYGGGSGTGNLAAPIPLAVPDRFVAQTNVPSNLGSAAAEGVQAATAVANSAANINLSRAQSNNLTSDSLLKEAQTVLTDTQQMTEAQRSATQSIINEYQGDAMKAQIGNLAANTALSLNQSQTAAVMRSPNLSIALQTLANMRDADQEVKQRIQNLANTNEMQQLQLNMTKLGVVPGSNGFSALLGMFMNILGVNMAGQNQPAILPGGGLGAGWVEADGRPL